MNLTKIKQIAFNEISEKICWSGEKSEKYYHGERVAKLALTLREYILPGDDSRDDIITVAGWFHDCAHGQDNHALAGAERAKILLAGHCSDDELREIYDIMYRHDDRDSDRALFSDYAKLQQDADHLDHFGTYIIWRNFVHASTVGRNIIEEIADLKEMQERMPEWGSGLNFDISRKIYREKSEFYDMFTERFSVEGTGGIWNENIIKQVN